MSTSRRETKGAAAPRSRVARDLYDQPGHLLRRAHQISVGMFRDVLGEDITPIQYAILRMVHECPGIDQVSLAHRVALDTSTTAQTAARLQAKGWIERRASETDRRQLALTLSPAGEALIDGMVASVRQLRLRLLQGLEADEQELFMQLLQKFVHLNNAQSRAPLRADTPPAPPAPRAARKPAR